MDRRAETAAGRMGRGNQEMGAAVAECWRQAAASHASSSSFREPTASRDAHAQRDSRSPPDRSEQSPVANGRQPTRRRRRTSLLTNASATVASRW